MITPDLPEIESIKSDLVGQHLIMTTPEAIVWKFDSIAEFYNIEILNKVVRDDYFECEVAIQLRCALTAIKASARLLIGYRFQDGAWALVLVRGLEYRQQMINLCGRCRKPQKIGQFACQECGHTVWGAIAALFFISLTVKAAAVCGGFWFDGAWTRNLSGWGGGFLAGYFLLGAINSLFVAFQTSRSLAVRVSAESASPSMKLQSIGTGLSLFNLLVVIGFILLGNTIPLELGLFLAFLFGILGIAVLSGMIRAAMLSSAKEWLPVHLVAEPATARVRTQAQKGITAFDSAMVTVQSVPAEPAQVQAVPRANVRLRVSSAGTIALMKRRVIVLLDGLVIGTGSVRRGFDAQGETTTGLHELQLRWDFVIQNFEGDFPVSGDYEAEFYWSWFWCKFMCRAKNIGGAARFEGKKGKQ